LNRLAALGLLRHLDRRVGGVSAGSAAHIWAVTETGDRLLHLGDSSRNRQRYREPSERLLAHALAIGSRRIDLTLAERSGQLELIEVATEPNCWRPYLGPVGERLVLQPDLAAVTASPGSGYEDCWFIEVDLSSEHLPTVLRKCGQYEAYRRTGREQQERGTFPIVIWVMSSDTRADELARRILGTPSLDPALFRVTTPERFIPVLMGRSA
jgi:hypothetical protein